MTIAVIVVVLIGLAPSSIYAEELTSYDIRVDMSFAEGTLEATESVRYPNRTGARLDSIVFNVTPAHLGAFELVSATAQGQPVKATLKGVTLEVPLPNPLEQNATATVDLRFKLTAPRPGNLRFGKGAGIFALGNWYPVVAMYRASAADWDRHAYTDVGDAFFTEDSNYTVSVTSEVPLNIAHTGHLTSEQENQQTFEAKGVRDFALAASDVYEIQSETVGNVTVSAFYLPEHADAGAEFLRSGIETVAWMSEIVGLLPYSSIHVVETATGDPAWVGQEYPGIVFIGTTSSARGGGRGSYVASLVVHEVIHQWFYSAVGDDQLNEPWLDEAVTTFLSNEFYRYNREDLYPEMWQILEGGAQASAERWGDKPVNSSIYDYANDSHYFGIVYRKGAVFLNELRKQMGDDAFYAFLRQYYSRFSGRIATGRDFLDLAQSTAGEQDIRPLIQSYFTYPEHDPNVTLTPQVTHTPSRTAVAAQATGTPDRMVSATPSSLSSPTVAATASPTLLPSPVGTEAAANAPSASPVSTLAPTPSPDTHASPSPELATASPDSSSATPIIAAEALATEPTRSADVFDQPGRAPVGEILLACLVGLGLGGSVLFYLKR